MAVDCRRGLRSSSPVVVFTASVRYTHVAPRRGRGGPGDDVPTTWRSLAVHRVYGFAPGDRDISRSAPVRVREAGPRAIQRRCTDGPAVDLARHAYRPSMLDGRILASISLSLLLGCGDDAHPTDHDARTPDAASPDAPSVDASGSSFGPVDCRAPDDCPGAARCESEAPGGICVDCVGDGDCPLETTCSKDGLACLRGCVSDDDCNAGKYCDALGVCSVRSCNDGPCPAPYRCAPTGLCARPSLLEGPCPAGWIDDPSTYLCYEP